MMNSPSDNSNDTLNTSLKNTNAKQEFHITVSQDDEAKTAVDILATVLQLSKKTIKQAMQKGCVWLEKPNIKPQKKHNEDNHQKHYIQRLRRAKKALSKGDVLHVYYDENIVNTEPQDAILVSDESDYSIWNKPSGMLSQGSKWGDHCTINRWVETHLKPERPAFIVHRLDRAASGLIIIAHKKKIAATFATLFQERKIKKQYRVSVEGDFSSSLDNTDTVKNKLKTQAATQIETQSITIKDKIYDKPAVSHCHFVSYDQNTNESIINVDIETGRKHQIRKHLAVLQFPVVGDRLYGSGKNKDDLKLKAVHLSFICPVSGENKVFEL